MLPQDVIKEYPIPTDLEKRQYCVFPNELEEDPLILFHATPIENVSSIIKNGLKIPDPNKEGALPSVFFGARSAVALTHAMTNRKTHGEEYCILRFGIYL
ncbi:MAG: hypothetical protein L3J15_03345 [Devosiaceae bacterium]|nr:hypothetical protein [Devosiaceae bacterium]